MSQSNNKNAGTPTKALRRREFIGATLGGVAAVGGGFLSSAKWSEAAQKQTNKAYNEKLETPVVGHAQVIVAGGGPSGFIAALAAARSGADTLLIERYPFLGGTGTAGLMTAYNGFRNQGPGKTGGYAAERIHPGGVTPDRAPEALQAVKGIPAEYIAELVRLGGLCDDDGEANSYPQTRHNNKAGDLSFSIGFDAEVAKVAMLNMIKKDGVRLRLHSWVVGPLLEGSRVAGVIVESKSGRQAFTADVVIDATGDGDIAARAGADFKMTPEKDQMVMSLMYRVGGVTAPRGGIRIGDKVVRWGPSFSGDGLDADVLTRAEIETRLKLWDSFQESKKRPGYELACLLQTGTGIAVRETRHIVGEHTITAQDAIKGTRFPDVIAISANPMPGYEGKRFFFAHEGFDVPYRSLIPVKVDGLVLTGRCISSEQGPFRSARSMAPAMAIGHASGCAAALAAKKGVNPRKLDVKELQKLLVSQKAELRL